MELITILSHCHHFRGFVYQHARLSPDKRSIEIAVRPRKGSPAVCSWCHQPAPGYDQLAERRYEFIPLSDNSSIRRATGGIIYFSSPTVVNGRVDVGSFDKTIHA
jgi:hypothetical protein